MNEGKGFSFQFRTKSIQRASLNFSGVRRLVIEHRAAHWADKEREALIARRNHLGGEFLPYQLHVVNFANGWLGTFLPDAWLCHTSLGLHNSAFL